MPISDQALVGNAIIADSNFDLTAGYRDDFDTLDIETSSTVGNRTGAWKKSMMHANLTQYGFVYGSDEYPANGDNFVHAAINFENQVYDDTRKPNPTGYSSFSVNNSVLTVSSRKVLPAEADWARVKDYELNPDGSLGTYLRNKQVDYTSGMISKYGRFAMSFGRFRGRVRTPYGADGASADVNQRKAVFPAAHWLLQDVPYGCDINGEPFGNGNTTYRGARPNGGGVLAEIDIDENFGESETSIHQTTHFHPAGTPQSDSDSDPKTIPIGKNLRSEWRETGVDVFPEKIAFFENGIYTHVVDTPDEIRNGLPMYEVNQAEPWNPVMVNPTTAKVIGRQTHADGSTRYMCFVPICNLARDGKYPRDLAKETVDNGGTLPAHQDDVSMEIDWLEARPLIVDNPDNYPLRVNGVPVAVDSVVTPPPTASTLSTRIPTRLDFSIDNPSALVNGQSVTVRGLLPAGQVESDNTYKWMTSSGITIIGSDTGLTATITPTTSLAEGQSVKHSIQLESTPV